MRSRKVLFYACVAFAVIGLSAGGAAFAGQETPKLDLVRTFQVSGGDVDYIGGLAPGSDALYTGDILWDEYENSITGYHCFSPADGVVAATSEIPGANDYVLRPAGMASNGGYLYQTVFSSESGVMGIVKYTPGNPAVIDDVYQLQGTEPEYRSKGLAHDGKFIWQAHYSPDVGRLYAIDPATGDRVNTLFVDPYPYGLAYDGRYFWVSHHDPSTTTSYVAKYDRSENRLATYSLPTSMAPNAALGDLAVTSGGLFAHVLGSNDVAHFTLPASTGTPPAMGSGVQAVFISTDAAIAYDGKSVTDSQTAANYGQLPIAASVERQATGSAMDVAGLARSYYDEDGVHNVVNALAYGLDHESELQATGTLTVNKSILITPSSCGLAAGTAVNATGTLTFTGLLQAMRDENEGWPDATDLAAVFTAHVIKTGPGSAVTCFNGSISLLGQERENWVRAVLTGDANTAALREACKDLIITDGLASLDLDHVPVGFSVPAVVGQTFYVKITFHADAYIPEWAYGLGAEVCFGTEGELGEGYFVGGDPEAYGDGYGGTDWPPGWFWGEEVPEPSITLLLLTGGLLAVRRRKRNLN